AFRPLSLIATYVLARQSHTDNRTHVASRRESVNSDQNLASCLITSLGALYHRTECSEVLQLALWCGPRSGTINELAAGTMAFSRPDEACIIATIRIAEHGRG